MTSIKMYEENSCASGEYFKLRLELFHLTLGCQNNCFCDKKDRSFDHGFTTYIKHIHRKSVQNMI